MKKLLLSLGACIAITTISFSQTTIFSDDFENGTGNWTLNVGGFGANDWIVNNAYAGVFLTSTPTQPVGITNAPTSQYLHIYNAATACQGLGECQAVFLASSGGDKTAEMTNNISTTGMTGVTFDFYYLCMGAVTTYGNVEYSTDNGTTWTAASPNYQGQMQWTPQSLTNAAWDNQATLKFRFHWFESTVGNDPAFAVDQVLITGTTGGGGSTAITTSGISQSSWCEGTTFTDVLNFTSTGTFNAPNIYTAEMSDASGSFAAPTTVGTLASSASGPLSINIAVPGSMPAGTGYRFRVFASDPLTTGTDNGTDITIDPAPTVNLGTFSEVCVYTPFFTLTGGTPSGGTYSGPGVAAGSFDPAAAGLGTHTITYTYTDAGTGCSGTATETIFVSECLGLSELDGNKFRVYPNPTKEAFTITSNDQLGEIQLIDLQGKVVKHFNENETVYNVSDVNAGVYIISVELNGVHYTKRLIIE